MVVDTSSASLTLRQLQLTQLRMLRVFAAVCERHGLRFWLTAGTLLGAIRHGGFIPWDDDVDVAMPRRDFERLGGLSREWEAEGCCWQSEKTDRNYPFPFGKLLFQGLPVVEAENGRIAMRHGCFIDVFPLDVCPRGVGVGALFYALHGFLTSVLKVKVNPEARCGFAKRLPALAHRCAEILPIPVLKAARRGLVRSVAWLCRGSGRWCTLDGAHGYPAETYEATWFGGSRRCAFEGRPFPVPSDTEAVLSRLYGSDWGTPSRDAERGPHFILDEQRNAL